MLERLKINNIGGIGTAELLFNVVRSGENFVVITGESGAGKSSVVRAIEILSGKRSQTAAIRAGEDEAHVMAIFFTSLPPSEEGNLFAERTCLRNGRGGAYLQEKPLPLASYSQAMSKLLRIQSQFAQMELLDSLRQLAMVDISGGAEIQALLAEMKTLFQNAITEEKAYRSLLEKQKQIEIKFADAEKILPIAKACRPEAGLEDGLERQRKELTDKIALLSQGRNALDEISGGAASNGLLEQLENAFLRIIRVMPDEMRKEAENGGNEALINVQKIIRLAEPQFSQAELGLMRDELEETERRLGAIRKLKRMTNSNDEAAIAEWCREAEESIAWLQSSRETFSESEARAKAAKKEASRCAIQLRDARKNAATKLEKRVNECLRDLAMEETSLSIRFSELKRLRRDGADEVSFILVTPKREGSVDKIASGGELSRLLLSLQLSLPDEWLPETLVFDEVEAGLGGRAAVLSGEKLRALSSKCQVVLVTHEASIAALGTEHFVIDKDGGEAFLRRVEGEERISELARMLAGDSKLIESRKHAERLLEGRV